jgi:hypothetical protein
MPLKNTYLFAVSDGIENPELFSPWKKKDAHRAATT